MKSSNNSKKYYLGLDMGTDSCGWCVTDDKYNIIRSHKKTYDPDGKLIKKEGCHLWGARLFGPANTAKNRRLNRTARRRLARRRRRIILLRELFQPEMDKIDPNFFRRLDQSNLWNEDKDKELQMEHNFLFNDKDLTDKEYYKDFPTIYHLRKAMVNGLTINGHYYDPKKQFDIREVYLVLAHMIKYRGNFLMEGDVKDSVVDSTYLKQCFDNIDNLIKNSIDEDNADKEDDDKMIPSEYCFNVDIKRANRLINLFKNESGKQNLKDSEKIEFGKNLTGIRQLLLSLINGSAVSLKDLLPKDQILDEEFGKNKIDFSKESFENDLDSYNLNDFYSQVLLEAKKIYDFRILAYLLHDNGLLCDAMFHVYEEHKEQLAALKRLYKKYATKEQYYFMFRDPKILGLGDSNDKNKKKSKVKNQPKASYVSYIGYTKTSGKRKYTGAHVTKEEIIDDLIKQIKDDIGSSIGKYAKYIISKENAYKKDKKGKGTLKVGAYEVRLSNNNPNNEETIFYTANDETLIGNEKKENPYFFEDSKEKRDSVLIMKALESKIRFLPRQNSRNNGVFPYQLNLNEMRTIIENQSKYYPFLKDKAPSFPDGKTEEYKIVSLLKFKIPYYIGPLSQPNNYVRDDKRDNHWVQFKGENNQGIINPWNFSQIVDLEGTADKFISNLTNYCTYIFGENTLPKESLLFQTYKVLNDLNNLKVNEQLISKEDKDYVIENVYLKKRKIKGKDILNALKHKYKDEPSITTKGSGKSIGEDEVDLTMFNSSLSSFIDMSDSNAFGPEFYKDSSKFELAEKVIELITIVEDKDLLKERLKKLGLSDNQVNFLSRKNYSGWAPLSRKLLDGITIDCVNENTDEAYPVTIIDVMRDTPLNFMEIYETKESQFSGFKEKVAELNDEKNICRDDLIDESYASPAMKRSVRQTFKVIDELKNTLNIDHFDRIFVEATRAPGEAGKMVKSRKKQLQEAYDAAKDLVDQELRDDLEKQTDDQLRRKKVYLYFMQLGRSVYSGEKIDLNELDKKYDIDHIIPQAKLKDDSFNNMVLVERELNNIKQDNYPIPSTIISEQGRKWIQILANIKDKNKRSYFMPKDKANRLLRPESKQLTLDELNGFINRQLTLTNQSVKAVCDILKMTEKGSGIVYSKANFVSDFRKLCGELRPSYDAFVKVRDINDFHHANDAYLNIVVGNVYYEKFKNFYISNRIDYDNNGKKDLSVLASKLFTKTQADDKTGNIYWEAHFHSEKETDSNGKERTIKVRDEGTESTFDKIEHYMELNDPLVTQMRYTQKGDQGLFGHITLMKKAKIKENNTDKYYPLKQHLRSNGEVMDVNKYGGYSHMITPYYLLVKSEGKKGKHIYSLESIPTIYLNSFKNKKEDTANYLSEKNKLKNPIVLLDKLLIKTIVKIPYCRNNDSHFSLLKLGITGRSGNDITYINLSELILSIEWKNYYRKISNLLGTNVSSTKTKDLSKYTEQMKNDPTSTLVDGSNKIKHDKNNRFFSYLIDKVICKSIFEGLPKSSGSFIKLESKYDEFCSLNTLEQAKIIATIIKLLSCKSVQKQDLSLLSDLPSQLGEIAQDKKLPCGSKISYESCCGLKEYVLFVVPND